MNDTTFHGLQTVSIHGFTADLSLLVNIILQV